MRNLLKRLQLKGFTTGFLLATMLTSAIALANSNTVTREITFGVGVTLDGQQQNFDVDNQPFIMGGRTFLPVRAVADMVGLPVDFDPITNTVILGNPFAGQQQPLNAVAPMFDGGSTGSHAFGPPRAVAADSRTMAGVAHSNVMVYYSAGHTGANGARGGGQRSAFSLHNLNGQFRMLTGYFGRIDGTGQIEATINFYGEGNLLSSISVSATDMPTPVSVFVEGVRQLRVEVVFPAGSRPATQYAFQGFLE